MTAIKWKCLGLAFVVALASCGLLVGFIAIGAAIESTSVLAAWACSPLFGWIVYVVYSECSASKKRSVS
jgi:hypothetical protein